MKNLVSLPLALAAGLAVSCGGGPKEAAPTEPYRISFDLSSIDRSAPFPAMSEMIEDIEYVKLETTGDFLIGGIYDRPVITDEHIIVFDRSAGLLQYSREGRFIRRIGHIGRGPGEYPEWGLGGIYVDEAAGILHGLVNDSSYGIMRYDLATGKFIEKVPITDADGSPLSSKVLMGDLLPFSDGVFLVSKGEGFTVSSLAAECNFFMILDIPAARIIHKEPSRVYNEDNISGMAVFLPQLAWYDTEGRVTVYENGADTMYVVRGDASMSPRAVADFGGREFKVPVDMGSGDGLAIRDIRGESDRYIMFDLADGKPFSREESMQSLLMSFDKTTGERRLVSVSTDSVDKVLFSGPANDIDGGFSYMVPYDENMWWWSYDAYKMKETLTPGHFERVRASVKFPDRLEKLQALVATLKEDDNPVIAIAHLKHDN